MCAQGWLYCILCSYNPNCRCARYSCVTPLVLLRKGGASLSQAFDWLGDSSQSIHHSLLALWFQSWKMVNASIAKSIEKLLEKPPLAEKIGLYIRLFASLINLTWVKTWKKWDLSIRLLMKLVEVLCLNCHHSFRTSHYGCLQCLGQKYKQKTYLGWFLSLESWPKKSKNKTKKKQWKVFLQCKLILFKTD